MQRIILPLLALCAAGLLAACGPTAAGIEARKGAQDRLNAFNTLIAFNQAEQAFNAGRLETALRTINETIARYPEVPSYHLLQGRIHLELHQLEKAHRSFQVSLEKSDARQADNAEAHYFMGILFQRWSDFERAYEHYLKASQIEASEAQYLLAAAETLVAMDRLEEARALIEPKLSYFEQSAALHQILGQVAMLEGRFQDAARHYTQAQLLNPDDPILLLELARAHFEAGNHPESLRTVRDLQARSAGEQPALLLLEARCLALLQRHSDARNVYQRICKVDPANVDAWIELGTVAWEIGDYQRVAQCAVRAITLAPQRFEGYMLRGIKEQHHGNLEGAAGLFRQAAELAPRSPLPRLLLSLLHRERGEHAQALALCRSALQIEPGNVEAQALLGRLEAADAVTSAASRE
jgi:tetratricopeptide (TPR) repeat protein